MNRSERFYRIDQLLTARKVVTRQVLLDELEISWATLKRDLAFLKDRFNAPIIHDRDAGRYRFAEPGVGAARLDHALRQTQGVDHINDGTLRGRFTLGADCRS